jgi:uncharacterized protein YigE (DUF2233 family)
MKIRSAFLFFILLSASACSLFIPASTKEAMVRSEQEVVRLKKELKELEMTVLTLESEKKKDLAIKTVSNTFTPLDSMQTLDSLMRYFVKQLFTASPIAQYPIRINMFDNSFDAYVVKVKKSDLRLFWNHPDTNTAYRNFYQLKHTARQQFQRELIFATNGGMFEPDGAPKGLYIEAGDTLVPLDTISARVGYLNFYLQPNGVFLIDKKGAAQVMTTSAYQLNGPEAEYATQSGPMLVIDNTIHPAFTRGSANKYIRSGVGIIDPDHIVFIISNKPVNFFDFATLFRDYFGCQNALYLDGAISKMYVPTLKREKLKGNFGPIIGILDSLNSTN